MPLDDSSKYYYIPEKIPPGVELPAYMAEECEFDEVDEAGKGQGQKWVCKVMRTLSGLDPE